MKFLLLNQTFYPDVVSTAQHLADLAAGLAARGHEVTVIAGRRAYDDPQTLFPRRQTWRGVRILRVGSTGFGKSGKWQRALDCTSFTLLCCCRAALLPAQDVVVALTSPPLISVLGLALARLWQGRFAYWVMDLNPDEAIAAGWLRAASFTARWLERLSRLTLQKADRVVVLDRFMFAQLCQKGVPPGQISISPPWSHDNEVRFDGLGRHRFRERHGLEGKFVVMYSGNHSPCHPLDSVLAAAGRLAGQEDIIFCFVGGGTEFRKIRGLVSACGSGETSNVSNHARCNILCLPYQPLSELSASLSAADLHLAILGDRFVGLVHPCKIYNILRVGAPVVYIGPSPSPVSELLAEANGQVLSACISHGNVDALVQQIERIRNTPRSLPRPSPFGMSGAYSQEKLVARLQNS